MGGHDRAAAVRYAHLWAYGRNPRYYDYEGIGGDCTNFASQCIYAGTGVMNYTPTFGWYYINANDKAPAWTGVEYLYNFLTRRTPSAGPFAGEVPPERIRPGDIVQLSFDGAGWQHSPVVVAADRPRSYADILVAAAGRRESVGAAYFRAGQTGVDVGIHYNEETQKLCGDVALAEADGVVRAVTPVPGGVGALTTAVLAAHTAKAAARRIK